jgi:hypothetical protein
VSVNSTYRIPSRHARAEYRCRPGERKRRGGSGSNGANCSHNSSETRHFNGFTRPRRRRGPTREIVITPAFDSRPRVPAHFEITSRPLRCPVQTLK